MYAGHVETPVRIVRTFSILSKDSFTSDAFSIATPIRSTQSEIESSTEEGYLHTGSRLVKIFVSLGEKCQDTDVEVDQGTAKLLCRQ